MFRSSLRRLEQTVAATGASVPSPFTPNPDATARLDAFLHFLHSHNARFDGVEVRPNSTQCRGLFARRSFPAGVTVLSIPMHSLTLTAHTLASLPDVARLHPPTLDDLRRLMLAHSIKDPVLYEQMHLALLLAAARMPELVSPRATSNMTFRPYLQLLPTPAVDDAVGIGLHKHLLDPPQLVEWDDHQRAFLTLLRGCVRRWGAHAPPLPLCHWAWRTVLSRMHLLPDRGRAPAEVGSQLHYAALSALERAEGQTRWRRRVRAVWAAVVGRETREVGYHLVPTLVPLLDMAGHLPSSNVSVEVQSRSGVGSCVELQALREIQVGEEIGMSFNRSHSLAFTLYRFGFLPP